MHELRDHLENRPARVIKRSDLSEILLISYNFLRWMLRDGCDTIRLDARGATWLRDGMPFDGFAHSPKQTLTFRETMGRIVEQDAIVRRHLEIVAEGPEAITYRIVGVGPTERRGATGATIATIATTPATAAGGSGAA